MKVIIAGSRTATMANVLKAISYCPFIKDATEIVSGKAPGADKHGETWAESAGIPVKPFPADWDNITIPGAVVRKRGDGTPYNAAAGPMRNGQMARYADALLLVWDGKSKGSEDMWRRAKEQDLIVHVHYFSIQEVETA